MKSGPVIRLLALAVMWVLLAVVVCAIAFSPKAHSEEPEVEDDYGRICLALAVYYEHNRFHSDGMGLVALVILNRLKDGRFADSLCGVVAEAGQFEGFERAPYPRYPWEQNPARWQLAMRSANRVIEGSFEMPGQCVTDKPILYFQSGPRAAWTSSLTLVCELDGHKFYTDGD